MKYYLKLLTLASFLTIVVCSNVEAATMQYEGFGFAQRQSITVKHNKALCSVQDVEGQHIKKVLANVKEVYNYDGYDIAMIEFKIQSVIVFSKVVCS